MTNYNVKTVDEYIAAAPAEAKPVLIELRKLMQSALPEAEEHIGYGKPYYKYYGWVAGFDVYKAHVGLEVWDGLPDDDRKQLEADGYKTGSVAFQIRFDQKVPSAIIKKLVKNQAKLNEAKKRK